MDEEQIANALAKVVSLIDEEMISGLLAGEGYTEEEIQEIMDSI